MDKSHLCSTRTLLNYQRLGGRGQDAVTFDPEERDTLPCVVCGHLFVMPVEQMEDYNQKNTALLEEYTEKMRCWSALPEVTSRGKAQKPAILSQLLR